MALASTADVLPPLSPLDGGAGDPPRLHPLSSKKDYDSATKSLIKASMFLLEGSKADVPSWLSYHLSSATPSIPLMLTMPLLLQWPTFRIVDQHKHFSPVN